MPLSGDAGEGENARGAVTWADTRGSSGERRLLLQLPHSMVSKGPGAGPGIYAREPGNRHTARPVRRPERRNLAAPWESGGGDLGRRERGRGEVEVGGARLNRGGARRLLDPKSGALRPGVYACAPASESVFPFPQRSPDLFSTSGQSPCLRGLNTPDCPPAQTHVFFPWGQEPTPSPFAGSLGEPDRGQMYRARPGLKGPVAGKAH